MEEQEQIKEAKKSPKIKKQRNSQDTAIMRVNRKCYNKLSRLKAVYATHLGKRRATFAELLDECAVIAELFLGGKEVFYAGGLLTSDAGEAWGAAVQESVRTKKPPQAPLVLLHIGTDDRFEA